MTYEGGESESELVKAINVARWRRRYERVRDEITNWAAADGRESFVLNAIEREIIAEQQPAAPYVSTLPETPVTIGATNTGVVASSDVAPDEIAPPAETTPPTEITPSNDPFEITPTQTDEPPRPKRVKPTLHSRRRTTPRRGAAK